MIGKIRKFFKEEIWNTPLHNKPRRYSFLIRQARIIVLAFKGFLEDRVSIRASSLTFFTLLSVVPVVAMAVGVAKGFGFQNRMEEFIIENFKGQEEVMNYVIKLSTDVLEGVQGGLLAGIGLVLLLISVIRVLTNIENSFNAIWQVKKSRSFFRKVSDYLAIILIAPFLIIVSSSVMVYISSQFESATEGVDVVEAVKPVIQSLFKLLPYVLIWLLFTLIYIIMPNTKVKFKYALIAGVLAGTLFQLAQWAYIHFQIGVTKYSALYGTFAALPLFLVWLQISWLIVLLGAEISFAYQNVDKYEFEADSLNVSYQNKKVISLLIVHYIIKKFENGEDPPTSESISHALGMPIRLARQIIFDLMNARILTETVMENPKESGYQPAIDINKITVQFVNEKLENVGTEHTVVKETKVFDKINELYQSIYQLLESSPTNILLKDLN